MVDRHTVEAEEAKKGRQVLGLAGNPPKADRLQLAGDLWPFPHSRTSREAAGMGLSALSVEEITVDRKEFCLPAYLTGFKQRLVRASR